LLRNKNFNPHCNDKMVLVNKFTAFMDTFPGVWPYHEPFESIPHLCILFLWSILVLFTLLCLLFHEFQARWFCGYCVSEATVSETYFFIILYFEVLQFCFKAVVDPLWNRLNFTSVIIFICIWLIYHHHIWHYNIFILYIGGVSCGPQHLFMWPF